MEVFTYSYLEKLNKETSQKIKNKQKISSYDRNLAWAASYGLDAINFSKAIKHKIVLKGTEIDKNTDITTIFLFMLNNKKGMDLNSNINDVIKKIGSYELFYLCNALNEAKCSCEIVTNNIKFTSIFPNLVLKVTDSVSDTIIHFDVYNALDSVFNDGISYIFGEDENNEFALKGDFSSFRQKVIENIFHQLN